VPERGRVAGWLLAAAALSSAATASNFPPGGGCQDLSGQPINFNTDWQADIKPIFNELFPGGRCTSCHNAGQFDGNLDLTDEGIDALYKLIPPGYVVPGRPQDSALLDKLNCDQPGSGGQRMPFGQVPLSIEEQGLVYDWIAQGAPGVIEDEPPIPRDFVFRDGMEGLR
jgi:hypothetical protein